MRDERCEDLYDDSHADGNNTYLAERGFCFVLVEKPCCLGGDRESDSESDEHEKEFSCTLEEIIHVNPPC